MAAHSQSAIDKAVVAGVERLCGRYDALLHEGERLRGLEGGAGRIGPRDRPVEEGLPVVARQLQVVLAAVAPDHEVGVVGGCGHHAEDVPRGGFDGDDAANLAFEEAFAECLEVDVDAEGEVLAGDGPLVEGAVLVASLDASVGIAQEDFDAFSPRSSFS